MFLREKFFHSRKDLGLLLKQLFIVFSALIFISLIGINFFETTLVVFFDLAVLIILFCWRFTGFAFYFMVALYPFIAWQFQYGDINVPYVDLLAIFVFSAWIVKKIFQHQESPLSKKDFPGLLLAGAFILISALSLFNLEVLSEAKESIKYLFRPIAFFYLMYVLLPYNLIKDNDQLNKVFRIIFIVGLFIVLMGLLSMIFSSGPWYARRAMPYSFGNFSPLGGNQNAIAEVLIVAIPIGLILYAGAKKYRTQGLILIGLASMLLVLLLTFSRAGWLAIMLELVILFFFRYRKKIKPSIVAGLILLFTIIPLILYFSVWQNISWVQASNSSRIILTQISWNAFLQHPIVGNGVNTFQRLVGDTFVFTVEFGDPLESHGFIQKIIAEQGALGLIAFLGFLSYVFYYYLSALKKEKNDQQRFILLCLFMMLSASVFFQLFSTSYYLSRVWLPIGVGLVAIRLRE